MFKVISKIKYSLKVKVQDWIIKHFSIVASPIISDTILVRDSQTGKKTNRICKYLIQISFRELHDDLIKSNNKGDLNEAWKGKKLLVSDTDLRYIIPINIQ